MIKPMQEGIHPLVPTMERGVVMRVEVIGRERREAQTCMRLVG